MADKTLYLGVNDVSYEDGTKLIDVAKWDEFGTEMSPPRPAYRMGAERGVKKNQKLISAMMINFARDSLNKKGAGKKLLDRRVDVLLTQLGRSCVSEIKNIIKTGETVTNAPATIKKKGFNWPLYHKGTFLKNVIYFILNKSK